MGDDESSSFDPHDSKHQLGSAHPPDKSPLWSDIPVSTDRWVLAHDSIRGELDGMKGALSALSDPLPDWARTCVKKWWAGHASHVREHCAKEEALLVPFASERIKWPAALGDDHAEVAAWQSEVGKKLVDTGEEAGGGGGTATVQELRTAWGAYDAKLRSHLLEEERTGLPLLRAYFTPEEVSPVGRAMMEAEPDTTVGAMAHFMGAEKFRSVFMKQQGIPFFVWHVAFKGRMATYEREMASQLEALERGKPPKEEKKSGWFS